MSSSLRERRGRCGCLALLIAVGCSSGAKSPDAGGAGGGGGVTDGGGQGGGGRSGFLCPGVFTPNDCSAVVIGLVCSFDPAAPNGYGVAIECVCVPSPGGPIWQCAPPGPCPAQGGDPASGADCPVSSVSATAEIGGCKYWPGRSCLCETTDGGAAWSCNDVAPP